MKGDFVMKFVQVEKLPKSRKRYRLSVYLDEFMDSNIRIAKVDLSSEHYKDVRSAYSSLHKSANNFGYPIKVMLINNEVYLVRKDI